MRDIKFRAISFNRGCFVFGDLVHQALTTQNMIVDLGVAAYGCYPEKIIEGTVGQFTGLQDKNGVDIYCGDILKGFDELVVTCKFSEEDAAFTLSRHNSSAGAFMGEDYCRNFKVIGNIHQHPELIGGDS